VIQEAPVGDPSPSGDETTREVPERVPGGRGGRAVCVLALAGLVVAGGMAWRSAILHRGFDYDEVLRAHEVWLVSRGVRPYLDFFEVHPPYFVLLAPVMARFADPCDALVALRVVSGVGNLAFVAALAAIAVSSVRTGRLWALLGVVAVAFHPAVLVFLAEFRIDGWGYALAAWSLDRFRRSRGRFRHAEMGFVTGVASLLFCLKIAMLAPLIVLFEGFLTRESPRRFLRDAGAYALGLGVAAVAFVVLLAAGRPEALRMYLIGLRFQSDYNAIYKSQAGLGLLRELGVWRALAGLTAAGVVAWVADRVRLRALPGPYHAALGVWLATQAVLVALPFKQYYAPWFLFATGFVAFLGPILVRAPGWLGVSAFVAACGVSGSAALAEARVWARDGSAGYERLMIGFMRKVALPGDRVVAAPPHHPIDRRDVFYLALSTLNPRGDADAILGASPEIRGRVSADRYREELEAHPPAFVVLGFEGERPPYSARQIGALGPFLRERSYRLRVVAGLRLAIRPDRVARVAEALPGRGRD